VILKYGPSTSSQQLIPFLQSIASAWPMPGLIDLQPIVIRSSFPSVTACWQLCGLFTDHPSQTTDRPSRSVMADLLPGCDLYARIKAELFQECRVRDFARFMGDNEAC
jgi:hypothetical protein